MIKTLFGSKVCSAISSRGAQNSVRTFSTAMTNSQKKNDALQDQHLSSLKQYYSDDLIDSIKLAESHIDSAHWQNRKPSTKFSPPYLDNFKEIDPYWDHSSQPQADFTKPLQPLEGKDIPKGAIVKDDTVKDEASLNLSKLTGLSEEYLRKLTHKVLVQKTVRNKTKKGNINSLYALVIVGDKNGMIGVGEGKDKVSGSGAVNKAIWNAKKNLRYIPRLEDRTILGDIDFRYHGVKLFLRSAPPGFGLRVNHFIFEICELAGIKDLSAKVYKARNGMNITKGTIEALSRGRSLQDVALARGKKIVDLRKAYYSP
ncbi:mitochondrial 37S ribosomal protein [Saccharomycopsis crataegensis]|uniref:Small ribosomal subunit protein uS5m n=1 Tax=Saccharomycopsis crataegensis TaxID=43959 RepID=A0AAV5QPB5_9ASCO|nr:mitochondrial 37S ribosomal protein [Saccharomycopsis crataegensis]